MDYDKLMARRLQYGPSRVPHSGIRQRRTMQENGLENKVRSSVIHLSDKTFEVPSMQYVQQLERIALAMTRRMRRLEALNRQLKSTLQQHTNDLKEIWSELDRKLEGR